MIKTGDFKAFDTIFETPSYYPKLREQALGRLLSNKCFTNPNLRFGLVPQEGNKFGVRRQDTAKGPHYLYFLGAWDGDELISVKGVLIGQIKEKWKIVTIGNIEGWECQRGSYPKTSDKKVTPEWYSSDSFNSKTTSLPPHYVGNDIIAVYERLSKAFPPKDEFESTEDYRKRLESNYPKDILGFILDLYPAKDGLSFNKVSYDADKQIMLVKITPSALYSITKEREGDVIIIKDVQKDHYVSDGKVHWRGKEYGVRPINESLFPLEFGRTRRISFDISPEEGRKIQANLTSLLVCRVKPDGEPPKYSFDSIYHGEPTYNSDIFFYQFFLNVDLFEIWVFDKKTGFVYVKDIIKPLVEPR